MAGTAVRVVTLGILLTGGALAVLGAQAPLSGPVDITLAPYAGGPLQTIRVAVAGDTLDFLFDTGGGGTILDPALATRLGCKPAGRLVGHRMTGEAIEAPSCDAVTLRMGTYEATVDVGVLDLMTYLGPNAPKVYGMISLHTFAGRALTFDPTNSLLTIESAASLVERVREWTPLKVRLGTGAAGGELTAHLAVPTSTGTLWLLWDSGHQGTTFLSPWAATALGIADTIRHRAEPRLSIGGSTSATVPIEVKALIHDGVLNAGVVARGTWTIDLASARMWVSEIEPLLEAPPERGTPSPLATEPTGWYDVVLVVNGDRQAAVMHISRGANALLGDLRFLGGDRVFQLDDVRVVGNQLTFGLPLRQTYPVRLGFEGHAARGTWGDPASRGGEAEARKRG